MSTHVKKKRVHYRNILRKNVNYSRKLKNKLLRINFIIESFSMKS